MELTKEDKDRINNEITNKINEILKKHQLPYRTDGLAFIKTSKGFSFLGNVRVHDESKVKYVKKEIEDFIKEYGSIKISLRKVVPCCEAPYTYINFHIDYKN